MASTTVKTGNYGCYIRVEYNFGVSGRTWWLDARLVFNTGSYTMGPWGAYGSTYLHTTTGSGGLPSTGAGSDYQIIGWTRITSGTYNNNGDAPSVSFGWSWGVNSSWGGMVYPSGTVTVTGPSAPRITPPSISAVAVSELSDTSAKLSFSVTNANNGSVSGHKIVISETNFGSAFREISGTSGTITGLEPNKTYYARAQAGNQAGTGYSAVKAFTTGFTDPGAPSNLRITYNKNEPIPTAAYTFSWDAGTAGSKPIAGYRFRLNKNNTEILMQDTESTATSKTINGADYNFAVGDVIKFGLYSYSKDYAGNQHFNGGGIAAAQVVSGTITIVSDKYIYVSVNGGTFDKKKMYISVNGGTFIEVKKEKFKTIK